MDADALAALSAEEFSWLLQGLSPRSRFLDAWDRKPKNLYDRSDIEAVHAAARR